MTFVTADSCRRRLERLTQLLFSAFPGSTIYQHTELLRVAHDALQHKVDAVFLEVETEKTAGLELMQMLRSQKAVLPVFIISETDHLREKAMKAGANGYFLLPDSEQQLLNAVRLVKTANEYRDN